MLNYRIFQSRYRFEGTLTLETALHIGTGKVATLTDSPILRDAAGRPLIPGSSLKGAFRAAVSRLAPNLGETIQICDPFGADDFCISSQNGKKNKDYQAVKRFVNKNLSSQAADADSKEAREALARFGHTEWIGNEISEANLLTLLDENLCPVCKVFGSPYYAAKAHFDDLPVKEDFNVTEIRDGVGIDRDSERAIDKIKFDFEVVPAGTTFKFGLTLENPSEQDKGLVAIGLREMEEGMIRLGGIRSRGLGVCRLTLEKMEELNLADTKQLMAYLINRNNGKKGEKIDEAERARRLEAEQAHIQAFFAEAIASLFTPPEE